MPLLLSDRAALVSPVPLLTTADARMLGITLSSPKWLRLRRGIYVDRTVYSKFPEWKKYVVRVHAFAMRHPGVILCFESAAVLHGLPHFGQTEYIHVFDPNRARSRRFGDVMVHTSKDPREVLEVNGIPVTSIRDTVVDLCRVLQPAQALSVADSAISPVQGGPLTLEELREVEASRQNRRGRSMLRWTWSRANGLSESPGESISRAVIEWTGFEHPEIQQEFRYEGALDRTDFYFASNRAIGESDGWQKYQLDDPKKAARLLADEKQREDRLRRNGHPFARWDLAGAWKVDPLVRALDAANVRHIAPPKPHMLKTLRLNPRAIQPAPRRSQ